MKNDNFHKFLSDWIEIIYCIYFWPKQILNIFKFVRSFRSMIFKYIKKIILFKFCFWCFCNLFEIFFLKIFFFNKCKSQNSEINWIKWVLDSINTIVQKKSPKDGWCLRSCRFLMNCWKIQFLSFLVRIIQTNVMEIFHILKLHLTKVTMRECSTDCRQEIFKRWILPRVFWIFNKF